MQRRRPYGTGYTTDIYVKNADGSNGHWVRPTAFPFLLRDPTWSPDGTRIAFTSQRSGQYQIWTMTASGGSQTRITHTSVKEIAPAWSH